jgi:hypothetical protein
MKKLLLLSALIPSIAYSSSVGYGEYRFGPETPENLACEIAEERARQDAIMQFVGEQIEYSISKNCVNDDCDFQREVFSELKGIITKVIKHERKIIDEQQSKNCVVLLEANVKEIENKISFGVETKQTFKDGENVSFSFVSNQTGKVYVFNFYDNFYRMVDYIFIDKENTEFKLPKNNQKVVAFLPKDVVQSKELLVFVFTAEPVELKTRYTANEFKSVLSSIDSTKKQLVYRNVTIVR